MSEKLLIARIGKSVALKGQNRLTLDTDFPGQFKKGASFTTKRGTLVIESYNAERGLVKFEGINTPEDAKKLTHLELFTTVEDTKENCSLKEDEHFWFDIEGCEVYEGELLLGVVDSIDRINVTDYLLVNTDKDLVAKELPKLFMVPYLDNFIINADVENKKIFVTGAFDILEAS